MAFDKAMAMMGGKKPAMGGKAQMATRKSAGENESGGEDGMAIHKDGNGYKTSDGQSHSHLGAALMHVAHHHEPDAKHAHVSHDGFSATSHGVHEDGQHDGPHDHENIEELKNHLGKFFNEEEDEGTHDDGGYGGIQ